MSDFRISGASPNARTETDIRLNYGDLTRIVAAANDFGTGAEAMFFSTDRGASWKQSTLPLTAGDALQSDPAVDWTSDGVAPRAVHRHRQYTDRDLDPSLPVHRQRQHLDF